MGDVAMQTMGLKSDDLDIFHETICSHHERRVSVSLLDRSDQVLTSLTPQWLDGQIDCNADAEKTETTRTLALSLLDPDNTLQLDTENPNLGAIYRTRQIRIYDSRYIPALGRWVTPQPFTGPITSLSRTGAVLNITGNGKEKLFGQTWTPLKLPKHSLKVDGIKKLMVTRGGEARHVYPQLKGKFPNVVNYNHEAQLWPAAWNISHGQNRQFFYDGRGVNIMRAYPGTVTFKLTESMLTSQPKVDYDDDNFVNVVHVIGKPPKGSKKKISATAKAAASHPLSAQSLAVNGKPCWRVRIVRDAKIHSDHKAHDLARRILAASLAEATGVTGTCLPFPHWDPLDMLRLDAAGYAVNFRIKQWTLPLSSTSQNEDMTFGYMKSRSKPGFRVRV